MLLDCRPVDQPVPLKLKRGREIVQLDPLEYTREFNRTLANVDEAFSLLCSDKTLLYHQELKYEVLVHIASWDDWKEYWSVQAVYYAPPKDELIENIHQRLGAGDAELLVHFQAKATRFAKPA